MDEYLQQSKWGLVLRSSFAALAAATFLLSLSMPPASATAGEVNDLESIASTLGVEIAAGEEIIDADIDAESGVGFVVTTNQNAEGLELVPAEGAVSSAFEDTTTSSVEAAAACRRSESMSLRKLTGGRMDGTGIGTSTSACGPQTFCVRLGQRVGLWIAATNQQCHQLTGARNVIVHVKSPAVCTSGRYYGIYVGWGHPGTQSTPPDLPDLTKKC